LATGRKEAAAGAQACLTLLLLLLLHLTEALVVCVLLPPASPAVLSHPACLASDLAAEQCWELHQAWPCHPLAPSQWHSDVQR
jgi:hypothetical protein